MPDLPTLRRGTIYSPRIGGGASAGGFRVYVTVNRHAGAIREVWIDVDLREGTNTPETGHMLARLLSHALRAGASLPDLIGDMLGRGGGPEGQVWDCAGVTYAASLADLVAQVLRVAEGEGG